MAHAGGEEREEEGVGWSCHPRWCKYALFFRLFYVVRRLVVGGMAATTPPGQPWRNLRLPPGGGER